MGPNGIVRQRNDLPFNGNQSLLHFSRVPLSSTHQFHTRATPFQPPKSLSSTPKTLQFHTENPSVPPPSVPHKKALYKRALQFFSLRQRMLYEMAESLINSIVGGPDYEHADVQEKIVLQRGNEIQRELSEFEFERKRADLSKEI